MVGIDIVQISRISALKEKFGEKFLRRVFCDDEIALIKSDETLAGFFAAKEAFSKALGTGIGGECGFLDIKITKTPKGAPFFEISPNLKAKFGIKNSSLSISHDGNFAIAAVILECEKNNL